MRCERRFLSLLHLRKQLTCGLTSFDLDVKSAHRYHAWVDCRSLLILLLLEDLKDKLALQILSDPVFFFGLFLKLLFGFAHELQSFLILLHVPLAKSVHLYHGLLLLLLPGPFVADHIHGGLPSLLSIPIEQEFGRHLEELMHVRMLEESLLRWVLEHFVCHELFEDLSVVDLLFESVVNNEPVDLDIPSLPNAEGPVSGLDVDHGVPVRVKDHNLVSRSKVNAKATDTRGQQEEVVLGLLVEATNEVYALLQTHIPIHSKEAKDMLLAKPLKDIEDLPRLAEYKHLRGWILLSPVLQEAYQHP